MVFDERELSRAIFDGSGKELLAGSPISVVITDPNQPDNPIVFVNAAFERTTGYSRASALGRNCRFLQDGDNDQPGVRELRRAISAGEPADVVIRNYSALGELFINRLHISPVFDAEGRLIAFVGMQIREPAETERTQEDQDTIDHLELMLAETNTRMRAHLKLLASLIRGAEPDNTELAKELLSHRVEALSLLYENLGADTTGALQQTVSAGEYVSKITATLTTLDPRHRVRFNIVTDDCLMGVDRAAVIGLIVTEVVTVLLGEVEGKPGHNLIGVNLREQGSADAILQIVSDFPNGPDNPLALPDKSRRIVEGLARQLGGELVMERTQKRAKLTLKFGVMG